MTTSTIHPGLHAATHPIAIVGGHLVYPARGGAGVRISVGDDSGSDDDILDDDNDEDDDTDEDDDEPDEEPVTRGRATKRTRGRAAEDEDDEDTEDDSAAALARMEAALGRANRTAAKHRRAGKTMDKLGIDDLPTWLAARGIDPETGKPYGDDVVDPDDDGSSDEDEFLQDDRGTSAKQRDRETARQIRAAQQRAESMARDKYVPLIAQIEATSALREAGFTGSKTRLERLLRMIDPNELNIEVDDEGFDIQGLDEQVEDLVAEFPELFGKQQKTTRTTGTGRAAPARRASGASDVDGGTRSSSSGRGGRKIENWMGRVVDSMDRRGR